MPKKQRYYPLFLSDGTNYITGERLQKYVEKYEWSADGFLQYVVALVKDETGAILVWYNKKHGSWQIPAGKIEKEEWMEFTLEREVEEELSLRVVSKEYVGNSKAIFYGMPWEWHFFAVQVEGELQGNEEDTMTEFDRVRLVPADNWLGWGVEGKQVQVTDPEELLEKWHMFAELYAMENTENYREHMKTTRVAIPEHIEENERYMLYRDAGKNTISAIIYEEYMHMITG